MGTSKKSRKKSGGSGGFAEVSEARLGKAQSQEMLEYVCAEFSRAADTPYLGRGAWRRTGYGRTRDGTKTAVPTVSEAGVPGFAVTQLYGILAPARTPMSIVNRLNKAMVGVIDDPEMSRYLANDGAEASGSNPDQFSAKLKAEHERWQRVVEKSGLRKNK